MKPNSFSARLAKWKKNLGILWHSDGRWRTVKLVFRSALNKFVRVSDHVFLYKDTGETGGAVNCRYDNVSIEKITSADEIDAMDFPRLSMTSYKKWLYYKNLAFVTYLDSIPVAYTWTQFHNKFTVGDIVVTISDSQCWIGPTFVHKKHRGKGLNKAQIQHQMGVDTGKGYVASVEAWNKASLYSFYNLGFTDIARIRIVYVLGKKVKSRSDIHEGCPISLTLR